MDFTEFYDDTVSTVAQAARIGNVKTLAKLIKHGKCVDIADNRGWRPLHHAASKGHIDCINLLLKQEDTDVNWRSFEGETALFFAAKGGYLDAVHLLLKADIDPNIGNNEEATPLLKAVGGNHIECVKELLEHNANIKCQYMNGWSVLHEAAHRDLPEMITLLLSHGADYNLKEEYDITPVFTAAQYGNHRCLQILLQAGADPNSAACDGGTPLFICTQENHIECLELLMKHGADVTKKTQDNYLPLHIAAHKGHYRCLELLLEKTNNDMLEGTLNPIMLTMFGLDVYTNCAELLVNNGIKLNTRTHFSVNPLEDILDEDNDFSLYNDVFLAPLNVAVIRNEENLVRFFLNHGADTNFVPYPCTMCLASHSSVSVSILDLLIRHGARPTCTYKRRPAKDNEKWIDYFPLLTALNSEPSNKIKRLFDSGFHLEHCLFQQCCSDLKCFFTALNDYFIAHKNRSILLNQLVLLALDYVGTVRLCSHAMNQLCIEHPSYSLIQSIIDNPRTLQQLCRVRILELLGTSLILKKDEVLRELILPDILKKFLIHEL